MGLDDLTHDCRDVFASTASTIMTGSFLVGGYQGYCNAQGHYIENESLESALTYGPTIVMGSFGAIAGGIFGFIEGGIAGADNAFENSNSPSVTAMKSVGSSVVAGPTVAMLGGALGTFSGAFQTLFGYGTGYMVGSILR